MKICIILSGLQRNFEPFIENQLNLVINAYDLDVFIFTSNQNALRCRIGDEIDYVKKENYVNDEEFFKSKYKNLKGIHIDQDDCKFNAFVTKNNITKHRNHTLNMINSYFKINECIKLMEHHENENNFKYDLVIRCRLDFFAYDDFLNPHNVNDNVIYLPISKCTDHKDDSGFIMNRNCIEYFKNFINIIIQFDDSADYIVIEYQLFDYLKKHYELCFTTQFAYRLGTNGNLHEIPFLNETHKLDSIEYKHCLNAVTPQDAAAVIIPIAPSASVKSRSNAKSNGHGHVFNAKSNGHGQMFNAKSNGHGQMFMFNAKSNGHVFNAMNVKSNGHVFNAMNVKSNGHVFNAMNVNSNINSNMKIHFR